MEERKLDTRESMELISRMIQNTRNRLENHAGRPFLVWGYTTVGIALLNYWFNIAGCHPAWCFTWFLIPIIGCLLMRLFPDKKPTEPRTEIDRIVGKVWLVSSLSLIPIFLFSLFHGLSYRHSLFELITLVMATATATTGMIVRSKIYIVAGLTCMALSVLFPLYDYFLKKIATSDGIEITAGLLNNEILIFAGVFFIMMVSGRYHQLPIAQKMFKELNPLLHSELRLAVMSILLGVEEADFVFIREQTGASAGNLSVQIDKLQKAGYITVEKTFRGKIPRTLCRITPTGVDAFEEYVEALKSYIKK